MTELERQVAEVARAHRRVDGQIVDDRAEQVVHIEEVRLLRLDLVEQGVEEDVLAADPAEVAHAVVVPHSVHLIGEVPAPHVGESHPSAYELAAGAPDRQPGVAILDRIGEVDLDTSDRGHHPGEAREVDLREVVDRDAEILLQGLDEQAGATVESGVDPVRTGNVRHVARDVDPEVPRDGEHVDLSRRRHDPGDDHHVAALSGNDRGSAEIRALALPAVGADQKDVERSTRLGNMQDALCDRDVPDLADAVVDVPPSGSSGNRNCDK